MCTSADCGAKTCSFFEFVASYDAPVSQISGGHACCGMWMCVCVYVCLCELLLFGMYICMRVCL